MSRKIVNLFLGLSLIVLSVGCQNTKSKAVEGAVVGGVVGAAAGGIIGSQMHSAGAGVGIGAAVGAVAGGLIGSQIEKKPAPGTAEAASGTATTAPATSSSQLTLQQIVDLSKQGVTEAAIIEKIKVTNTKLSLNDVDIKYLQEQGISQKIIDAMQGKF